MAKRPGGETSARPLHFIWICDCSGSMQGDKIQTLNVAIREAIPHMRGVARENVHANILVRAIKFSDGAQWHISQPTPVEDFEWVELTAGGVTDMGRALHMVADQLKMPPMEERGLPPVLALVSDGQPTDDFGEGLQALMDEGWGQKAVRVAIAIGQDADRDLLQRFAHPEIPPLPAKNAETLVRHIRWVSTQVTKAAASPPSQGEGSESPKVNVPIVLPTDADDDQVSADDVW